MKTGLELNALMSTRPLSIPLGEAVSSYECRLFKLPIDNAVRKRLRRIPYALDGYASKHFVAHYVRELDRETNIYIVSSCEEAVEYLGKILSDQGFTIIEERALTKSETESFMREHWNILVDSYLRLALRNYLLRRGYLIKHIGQRALWSRKGSNHLYIVDVDVDPKTLNGYISVDFKTFSSSSLWDKIVNGSLSEEALFELVGASALVPYKKSFAYGKISGFIKKKVSETIETRHGLLNLVEYYAKKDVSIDPAEYPIVEVKLVSPELDEPLIYPPSQVRPLLPTVKPEPHTRHEEINRVLNEIASSFKPLETSFKPVTISQESYVDVIKDIRLRYHYDFVTYKSPLISVQRENATPLRGKVNIPLLVLLLPKGLSNRKSDVDAIGRFLQRLYETYNMGRIQRVEISYYDERPSIDEQKVEFSRTLGHVVNKYSPAETIVIPVINHGYLFNIAKQVCSDRFFHARVVQLDTLVRILNGVREFVLKNTLKDMDGSINKFVGRLRKEGFSDKQEERFVSETSNILFSVYVEFIIQSEVFSRRLPRVLTWSLAEPADGEGRTLYLGYDVSRSVLNRSEVAAIFILYDSYGNMVSATVKRYSGERVSREFLESVLLSLIAHYDKGEQTYRLVLYKDGYIRGVDEARNLSEVFRSIGVKAGFKAFDVVGIVKRHNLRLFNVEVSQRLLRVVNPKRGSWVKLWSVDRHGVTAERALAVSSRVKDDGTVKPVVIEHYDISKSNKRLEDIVVEYLRLCRLNFWNPLDGISKYPLPVFMADKLAHLSLRGVDIKVP